MCKFNDFKKNHNPGVKRLRLITSSAKHRLKPLTVQAVVTTTMLSLLLRMKLYPFLAFVFLFIACNNKDEHKATYKATFEQVFKKQGEKTQGELHLDTLQVIHFEGNFDYWYGVFINSHKDTVQLIMDDVNQPS
jgi:hypothetical protein